MRETLLEYLIENAFCETDFAFSYRRKLRYERLSYAKLAQKAFQFARELEARNIGKSDHILIWAENSPEWVCAFYGALLRGVIVVPLDEQSNIGFVERVCQQTSPKLLLGNAQIDCSNLNYPKLLIEDLTATISHHSTEPYQPKNISRNDLVEIIFTSGTTGEPKGVKLTHENILANVEALEKQINKYRRWEFLVHPLKVLTLLPLSHVFGQVMNIFVPPILRFEVVFQNSLKPSEIIETIKRERISILATVPRVLETLQHKIEQEFAEKGKLDEFQRELTKPRHWLRRWWKFRRIHHKFGLKFLSLITGGATLSTVTEQFWGKLGFTIVQGYGLTETAALVSLNNPFSAKSGSIGKILSGQEVKIGEGGEILVRGKNVSPDSQEKGWLRTGDIGSFDETGRLFFKGRKKDVIVTSSGLNIYPEDLEAALNRQPEVLDCAVVGIEDEPFAALILREGSNPKSAVAKANENLAPYQQIRRWLVWSEPDFPRTSTQKVRKTEVAEIIRQKLKTSKTEKETSSKSGIAEIVSRLSKGKSAVVQPNSSLGADLNFDSLSRTELLSAIEDRYQIDLDESVLTETTKIADIEKIVRLESGEKEDSSKFSYPYWSLKTSVSWLRIAFYYSVILPVTKILCPLKVHGLENLESLETPVIFAPNHITDYDAGIIKSILPSRFRNKLAIAMDGEKLEGFRCPPQNISFLSKLRLFLQYCLVIALFNVFPLPKKSGFRKSFRFAGDAMDLGYNIMIFPEGQLTKDGKLQKFQAGIGILANGLDASVVPIAIKGLYELKAKGQRIYAPRGTVSIVIGKPLIYNAKESETDFARKLGERVLSLLGD